MSEKPSLEAIITGSKKLTAGVDDKQRDEDIYSQVAKKREQMVEAREAISKVIAAKQNLIGKLDRRGILRKPEEIFTDNDKVEIEKLQEKFIREAQGLKKDASADAAIGDFREIFTSLEENNEAQGIVRAYLDGRQQVIHARQARLSIDGLVNREGEGIKDNTGKIV